MPSCLETGDLGAIAARFVDGTNRNYAARSAVAAAGRAAAKMRGGRGGGNFREGPLSDSPRLEFQWILDDEWD